MFQVINNSIIKRLSDGVFIPNDPSNNDYAAYLQWLADGNTPDAPDAIDPRVVIQEQIAAIEVQITPRRIREALLSGDMSFIAALDVQIAQLRQQL